MSVDQEPITLIIGPDMPWIELWCRHNDVNIRSRVVYPLVSSSQVKGKRAEPGDRLIVLNLHRIEWDVTPLAQALVACGFNEWENEVGDVNPLRDLC